MKKTAGKIAEEQKQEEWQEKKESLDENRLKARRALGEILHAQDTLAKARERVEVQREHYLEKSSTDIDQGDLEQQEEDLGDLEDLMTEFNYGLEEWLREQWLET
jgi:hypothetical protein